jgi:Tfp pilus assembly PilM family ATPase/Tfp pilus assembly protein PilN
LFRPDNACVAIEIGHDAVKVIEARALKGKSQITRVAAYTLAGGGSAAEELALALRSMGRMPQKVCLNIPRHLVTARFLKIPSVDDSEIDKIVKIESLKHLPYTDEDIVYGYKTVERAADGYSSVLLVMSQADTVAGLMAVLDKAQAPAARMLSLSSEALLLWYLTACPSENGENVMLVNLDSDHVDIDVLDEGKLVFTRGVAFGPKAAKKTDKIISEINISINTYHKESSKHVSRVVLTGPNAEVALMHESFAAALKVPVEIKEQTVNIPIAPDAEKPADDVSFAELFGLALRPDDVKIDLLPERMREEARVSLVKNNLVAAVAIIALLAAASLGLLVKKLHEKSSYLSAMNSEIKKIKPDVEDAKKMVREIAVIREVMARKPLAVDIVSEIYDVTPAGVSLNILDFERGKSVVIRGSAPSLSDVFKYVSVLENSAYFEGVKVKYANKRTVENSEIADFEIDAIPSSPK